MMEAASARRLSVVFLGTFGLLLGLTHASAAVAAETLASQLQSQQSPTAQIFVFLFLMLGPLKIIGPFVRLTRGADTGLTRQIAGRATLISCAALVIAAVIGESQLNSYGIPVPVLSLAAGIILFLVALLDILHQFAAHADETGASPELPTIGMAMTPLAFPTIITPYGVATFVVLLAISPNRETQLVIAALTALVMLLNLVVMLTARRIMPVLGMVLPIFGGVFGVIQVALGLFIVQNSLHAMRLL
jgi:multiple antibiotic resistance protein